MKKNWFSDCVHCQDSKVLKSSDSVMVRFISLSKWISDYQIDFSIHLVVLWVTHVMTLSSKKGSIKHLCCVCLTQSHHERDKATCVVDGCSHLNLEDLTFLFNGFWLCCGLHTYQGECRLSGIRLLSSSSQVACIVSTLTVW